MSAAEVASRQSESEVSQLGTAAAARSRVNFRVIGECMENLESFHFLSSTKWLCRFCAALS